MLVPTGVQFKWSSDYSQNISICNSIQKYLNSTSNNFQYEMSEKGLLLLPIHGEKSFSYVRIPSFFVQEMKKRGSYAELFVWEEKKLLLLGSSKNNPPILKPITVEITSEIHWSDYSYTSDKQKIRIPLDLIRQLNWATSTKIYFAVHDDKIVAQPLKDRFIPFRYTSTWQPHSSSLPIPKLFYDDLVKSKISSWRLGYSKDFLLLEPM